MNMTLRNVLGITMALTILNMGAVTKANAQANLTLGTEFGTDASGNASAEAYSTGSGGFILGIKQGSTLLNAGNGSINIPLSVGVNTFDLFGEGDFDVANYGLNLFFNGANNAPGISVFAPEGTTTTPHPAFAANSAPITYGASLVIPGSGTLTTNVGGLNVTLTDYYWQAANVQNLDQVGQFTVGANTVPDFTGRITLTVTNTPEPGSLALVASLFTVGGLAWKRRKRLRASP